MAADGRQVEDLWVATFGEPPSIVAAPDLLLRILISHLPPAPPYGETWRGGAAPARPTLIGNSATWNCVEIRQTPEATMAELSTRGRDKLPAKAFAEPKQRAYPIEDKAHARNAKARASQAVKAGRMSKSEEGKIDKKADASCASEEIAIAAML